MIDMLKGVVAGLVFSIACIVSGAWGQELGLNLVYVGGLQSASLEQLPETYAVASHYFREMGVTFRLKVIRKDNPCVQMHNLDTRVYEILCLSLDAKRSGYVRRRKLTYYLLPPYLTTSGAEMSPTYWSAGMADGIGGDVALGTFTEFNQDGVLRLRESGVIIAHEVSHLLTATHQPSKPNLMHPNALIYVEQGKWLPVLRSSKRQVRRFLNGK